MFAVGRRCGVAVCHRIDQGLAGDADTVAKDLCSDGRKIAAGAVAGDHQRQALSGEASEVLRSPANRIFDIFKPGGEGMLGREPIVWHQHGATAACRKGARHRIKIVGSFL